MRILALSDRAGLEFQSGQVHYANCLSGIEVNLCCDISLRQVEQALISENYDGVFLSSTLSDRQVWTSGGPTFWDVLHYQGQDYIGSCADDLMLFRDKALSDLRAGIGLPSRIITRSFWNRRRSEALELMRNLTFPFTLESNLTSVPINGATVYSEADAVREADLLFQRNTELTEILVRKHPVHGRKYTVFVFGNGDSLVCCPIIIDPYASKQRTFPTAYPMGCPIVNDAGLAGRLTHCAGTLAQVFSVRDYCQLDFLVDTYQNIYFTGIDAVPCLNKISAYICTGAIPFRSEQVLTLLLLIFFQRTGRPVSDSLLHEFPKSLLEQLGF